MPAQSYLDLDIYRQAHRLAVEIHRMTTTELPKLEIYEEASQIRKSSKSITANIVEGFGRRRYKAEFIKFLIYAQASTDETIEHILLLRDTGSLSLDRAEYFRNQLTALGKQFRKFIQSVEIFHKT